MQRTRHRKRHWPRPSKARALVLLLGALLTSLTAADVLAQGSPHVPTEEQLRQRQGGAKHDDERDYQRESVNSVGQSAVNAAAWVKQRLSSLYITPARLLAGLGVLGLLFTWNKNKKKMPWAVLTVFSWLLLIFGVCAIFFSWPHMN
jgi:hypothetical protein